jgi:hypothetical protein
MDRAIDAAATQQCRVRRIDDCVHLLRGDVALHEFDSVPGCVGHGRGRSLLRKRKSGCAAVSG